MSELGDIIRRIDERQKGNVATETQNIEAFKKAHPQENLLDNPIVKSALAAGLAYALPGIGSTIMGGLNAAAPAVAETVGAAGAAAQTIPGVKQAIDLGSAFVSPTKPAYGLKAAGLDTDMGSILARTPLPIPGLTTATPGGNTGNFITDALSGAGQKMGDILKPTESNTWAAIKAGAKGALGEDPLKAGLEQGFSDLDTTMQARKWVKKAEEAGKTAEGKGLTGKEVSINEKGEISTSYGRPESKPVEGVMGSTKPAISLAKGWDWVIKSTNKDGTYQWVATQIVKPATPTTTKPMTRAQAIDAAKKMAGVNWITMPEDKKEELVQQQLGGKTKATVNSAVKPTGTKVKVRQKATGQTGTMLRSEYEQKKAEFDLI